MRTSLRALVLISLAGCGAKTGPAQAAEPVVPKAAAEARVRAQLATLSSGNTDGFVSFLTPDAVWLGAGAGDVGIGRDAVKVRLDDRYRLAKAAGATIASNVTLVSSGVADDARAVWTAHDVEISMTADDRRTVLPFRVTSLLGESSGAWQIVAQHWSIGVPNEQALQMAAQGLLAPLAPVGDDVAPNADPLVAVFQQGIADAKAWVASYSDRQDAFALGSAPNEAVAGGAAVKKVFGALVADYQVTLAPVDGIRAGMVPSGTAGWVASNLAFTTNARGTAIVQPYRALLVYVKDGERWSLVQSHFSNGQPPE